MKYRAEIDGLRALAVIPVILFHAGFELFSGGFVGVDVFFVISGYLITTILIEDIENKRFSIVNFYERRARRILPALFFVMLVCIPFAWMWMLPNQMKDFSQSLVAVSLFASNILFWRESGYFDAAAEEKPLLHTWSLAVEEQYYLLFPIFLILAWRFGKNRVFWIIVVMAAISLLLSEWGWRNKATANFYLAPTRAWELFAGSIAAFIVQRQGVQKNNVLALIGLAAIIFSIFFFNETTPFPSVYALVPVLGVVLLVLYADKETIPAKLLSTKGFVGVGLISYSAYLWHQPLLAFARIRLYDPPSLVMITMLVLGSFFLAFLSWKYVEAPFRKSKIVSPLKYALISITCIISIGILLQYSPVYERAKSYNFTSLHGGVVNHDRAEKCHLDFSNTCRFGKGDVKVAIWGDSHADVISRIIESNLHSFLDFSFVQNSVRGCPPIIGLQRENSKCLSRNEKVFKDIVNDNDIDIVVLSARWAFHVNSEPLVDSEGNINEWSSITFLPPFTEKAVYDYISKINLIEQTIKKLVQNGKKVVFIDSVPELAFHPISYLWAKYGINDKEMDVSLTTLFSDFLQRQRFVSKLDTSLASIENTIRVAPQDFLCAESSLVCYFVKNKRILYQDDSHLTDDGAVLLILPILDALNKLSK